MQLPLPQEFAWLLPLRHGDCLLIFVQMFCRAQGALKKRRQERRAMLPENPPLILIIEDEIPARSFLITVLMHAGYRVSRAATGCRGLGEFAMQKPDAVVLDLGLPDIAGTEVVRQVRERSSVPILALAGESLPSDVAAARDAGANDVMPKPFQSAELLARLKRLVHDPLNVGSQGDESRFRVGDLNVDLVDRRVSVGGQEVHLSETEFLLLSTLARHAGRVVTYRYLINQLWNSQASWKVAYLKLLVSSLRHKLESDAAHPRYVLTERGTGYRLAVE